MASVPVYMFGEDNKGLKPDDAGGQCNHCHDMFPKLMTCSNCRKARYCSTECQKAEWKLHQLFCLDPSRLTTADQLALSAYADEVPKDHEVRRDYGFDRAQIPRSENWLIGLFQGIIKHGQVDPRTIHRHRLAGTLVEYIKKFYDRMPVGAQGDYYPWFLKNQHLLAPPEFADSSTAAMTSGAIQRAWWFTGGSTAEPIRDIAGHISSWTDEKQDCIRFIMFLLHPGFQLSPDRQEWLFFGFCGYKSRADETKLWDAYIKLVKAAPFEEFHTAYISSTLPALFAAHGMRLTNPCVLDILSGSPRRFKSVWQLKQYAVGDYQKLGADMTADYGFFNCGPPLEGESVIRSLKMVYRRIFEAEGTDPLKLHEASLRNKVYQYAQEVIDSEPKFAPLMKNLHDAQSS